MHDIEVLIRSGERLIVLETEREGCFIEGFRRLASRSSRAYFQWTVTQGLLRLATGYEPQVVNKDINQLFAQIVSTEAQGVYVLVDFHHYLQEPTAIRHIKDVMLNSPQHVLILLSPTISLPHELKRFATNFRLPLPTTAELIEMVDDAAIEWFADKNEKPQVRGEGIVKRLVQNLCGLSYSDARRLARHAIFNDGLINQLDVDEVIQTKFELLNKENVLSIELDYALLDQVAGFAKLKHWLQMRKDVFLGKVQMPSADKPKGMLLLGVQGCGKSLAAKAVAGSWQLPLLHLDVGALYNRYYGQTEENLRNALRTAEKMQPCVLWMDEIEKGMSAVSGNDDVSKRMLATFLTWLAERKCAVFVVATANDVTSLPPELMRKGRFDEVFFVDLPDLATREAIFATHLEQRELDSAHLDLPLLAELSEGFSGAEIEQIIVSALYQSHATQYEEAAIADTDKPNIDTAMLSNLISETKPLSTLRAEAIDGLRHWATERAVFAH